MEHIIPPRDLKSWQNLPVSAIARFDPVVIASLEPDDLRDAMRYPYSRFPVVEDGRLTGILNRAEIQIALDRGAAPKAGAAYDVRPWQVIREIQNLLIESEDGIVVVTDRENGNPIAVVTLHDLLRAQLAISEREGS